MQTSSDLENPPPSYTSAIAGEDDSSSLNISHPAPEIQSPAPVILPPDTSTATLLPEIQPPPGPGDDGAEELPPYHRGRPTQPNFDFVRNSIAPPPRRRPVPPTSKRSPRRTLGIRLMFAALIIVPVIFVIWHFSQPDN